MPPRKRNPVTGEMHPEHQPLLVYLVNCWHLVQPRLMELTQKANIMNDCILFDLRTRRNTELIPQLYPPDKIMEGAMLVELEGIRRQLGEHPYLYQTAWCKQVSVAARKAVKQYKGEAGLYVLIAHGDEADHAPEGCRPLPHFAMHIATYFVRDLVNIAEHNLRGLQEDGRTDRKQVAIDNHRASVMESKRQEIMAEVEAAKKAREAAEAAGLAEIGAAAGSARGAGDGCAGAAAASSTQDEAATAARRAKIVADLEAAKRAREAQAAMMSLVEADAEAKAARRAKIMADVEAAKRAMADAEAAKAAKAAKAAERAQEEATAVEQSAEAVDSSATSLASVECGSHDVAAGAQAGAASSASSCGACTAAAPSTSLHAMVAGRLAETPTHAEGVAASALVERARARCARRRAAKAGGGGAQGPPHAAQEAAVDLA